MSKENYKAFQARGYITDSKKKAKNKTKKLQGEHKENKKMTK